MSSFPLTVLECKRDLSTFTARELVSMAKMHGIDTNFELCDLQWILALKNITTVKHAKMDSSEKQLIDAATLGDTQTVLQLINQGVDIDATNQSGATALIAAARYSGSSSNLQTVRTLLDAGADIDAQEDSGWSALMFAARKSNSDSTYETVELLLDRGADVNMKNTAGGTALMFAAQKTNTTSTVETVKLLLDRGADVNAQSNNGTTALMFAIRNVDGDSNVQTVRVLLDRGANVNLKTTSGKTALNYARENGNPRVLKLLDPTFTGTITEDWYEKVGTLGTGTYGDVFKIQVLSDFIGSRHEFKVGETYAMKTFKGFDREGIPNDAVIEIDTLNRVDHKNVVSALQTIDLDDCKGIGVVLPIASSDFSKYIHKQNSAVPEGQHIVTLDMLYQILCGLYYLHSNYIIHDDLKPANILLFENNTVPKISDLGFAYILQGISKVRKAAQTLWWKSPELLKDAAVLHAYEPDIWALGVIFYEAITREHPFMADSPNDVLIKVTKLLDNNNWKQNRYFSGPFAGMQNLIARMLDPNPTTRITAEQALQDPIFANLGGCPPKRIPEIVWNLDTDRITSHDRKVAIEWIFDVIDKFKQSNRVAFLAIDLFDRYLATNCPITRKMFQLVAIAAMSLTSKLFENARDVSRSLDDYVWMSANAYTVKQIQQMECQLFKCLDWVLFRPTVDLLYPDSTAVDLRACYLQHRAREELIKCLENSPTKIITTWLNNTKQYTNLTPEQVVNLEEINVTNNDLTEIPPELGSLKKLRKLDLANNQISNVPEELKFLVNLQKLNLNDNNISVLPRGLYHYLTKLKELFLKRNKITDISPYIYKLTNLQELWLGENPIKSLPEDLTLLKNLTILSVDNASLESLPENIDELESLEHLTLNANNLTMLPDSFGDLEELRFVTLANNRLTAIPKSLERLSNLHFLDLRGNDIPSEEINELRRKLPNTDIKF